MNHLPLIIKREYLTKVRNKSFIIMTVLSPLIMIGLMALVFYLTQINNASVRHISVLDESTTVQDVFVDTETIKYTFLDSYTYTLDQAKLIVEEKGDYGLLYISKIKLNPEIQDQNQSSEMDIRFYSQDSPSLPLISTLEAKIEKRLTNQNLKNRNVDLDMIEAAKVSVDISQENFTGDKTTKMESVFKLGFGIAAGYLLFMFIIIYGNMIMRSVIEEKTSRIIEVIISSVKPVQLMLGKIIGTSLAGITQFAIWILIGGVLLLILPMVLGIDMSQLQSPQQDLMQQVAENPSGDMDPQQVLLIIKSLPLANLVIAFLLFFISGYLLYSSLYAAIGAAVDNETDTQQFLLPIIMPLILAVYVGGFTVIEDPHGTVSTIFSFIPLTSPVVMLMRIPFGVPLWEQGLSLLILIGSFMFTVWFAGKIYRVGILMYGKKPSYKELLKWIKY